MGETFLTVFMKFKYILSSTSFRYGRLSFSNIVFKLTIKTRLSEIEVHLPISVEGLDLLALRNFLIDYTTFNTHIGFTFRIKDTSEEILNSPQLQSINAKWTNLTSIYYYSLVEFENFIFGLGE